MVYATEQECTEAGNMALRTLTVARFACNYVTCPKDPFHPEQDQE
jgi:hypothetical protein